MAGIGFELKKLFGGRGYLQNIKAYSVSSIVTIGPMIICIGLITVLQQFLYHAGIGFSQRELFQAATIYAFVFSLVTSSCVTMLVSRYISDIVYLKQYDKILPSLYGVLSLALLFGGMAGMAFYFLSPLKLEFKLAAYVFYMEMIVIWIQIVYASLLKDYIRILLGFLYGTLIAIVLAWVFIFHTRVEPAVGLMVSVDIGFLYIIVSYMIYFKRLFPDTNPHLFSFIRYFDRLPSLVFICFLYHVGMYAHNFVFWLSDYSTLIGGTFRLSNLYDLPMFYAYFSVTPTLVLFVVSVETAFYGKYRNYYQSILQGGNYHEITTARKEMTTVLVQEVSYIMEVQLVFSIVFLILGRRFLPLAGLTGLSIDIFSILVLGCYVFVMMYVVILLLLYFDDRKGALMTIVFFLPTSVLFTGITLLLGENFFGAGFFAASFLSLIIAIARLAYYVRNINYYTFCSQPILYKEKKGFFTMAAENLEKLDIRNQKEGK